MFSGLAVCICTHNRHQSLQRTLASLASQSNVDWNSIEVVIIDNNCTDCTASVVDAFGKKLPIRRAVEGRQGLSHARNRALAEVRKDLVLFTDDDVRLGPSWLAAYADAIRRFPNADYFGGRILTDWGQAKPRWIGDQPLPLIDGALVWFDHGAETRMFRATEPPPIEEAWCEPAGRLDRLLGTRLGEALRHILRRYPVPAEPGHEWPHISVGSQIPKETFWDIARAEDVKDAASE